MRHTIDVTTGEVTVREFTEPETRWRESRESVPNPVDVVEVAAPVLAQLAGLPPDALQRVLAMGVAITDTSAVDALAWSVVNDQPTAGVAVVADAARAGRDEEPPG